MKTPRVRRAPRATAVRGAGAAAAPVAPTAPETVPGGKVLARLHFFEQQRDLNGQIDVAPGTPELPATQPRAGAPVAPPRPDRRDGAPREVYLEAFNVMEELVRTAPAMPITQGWRPLGPFCIPHGQTYGSGPGSRPSVSGRISAVAVDPGNPRHILVGAGGGGVWESADSGNTWQPRTDDQPSLAVGAIAFDPSNPATVYTGTGEGNFFARLGAGLLRSSDGGTTWTLHATAPFVGIGFYDLIVDPLNGSHLLAATTGGLFESTNGGTTWTQRRQTVTWDLSMHPVIPGDPNSTREVFAACADGVFRSTNGGTGWSAVALSGGGGGWQRIAVCHAPSNGHVVYVHAAGNPIRPDDTPTPYLWRRSVFGGAFTAAPPPAALETGQAWYDWFADVAPNNPNVLYVAGINVHKGTRAASGAWSWSTISARPVGQSIHPDQHAIAFSPVDPNVVYVANDGGLYRSPNGGSSWQSLNKGLAITEFEFLAQHPQHEAYLIGGTQDNGTQRFESEEVWYHVQDGDGGDCGLNAASPYTCYHTFYGMGMERSSSGGGWGSWSWIGPNPPAGHSSLFYPPVEVKDNVVVQAGSSVFISNNTGTTWAPPVPLPAGAGNASALEIASPTRIYVGTATGRIYRIEFSGGAWQAPVALAQPRNGFVSDLLVDPTNANRIWCTYSSLTGAHVFRSDNAGTNWNNVSAGLPNIPANGIVVDPTSTDTVYVAMDVGVYRSTNAGGAWAAFSNLLPNARVTDLIFHQPSRLLRAATQSRGVWEIDVDTATMPDVEVYLRDSTVDTGRQSPSPSGVNDPFNQGSQTFWWQCTDIKVDSPSFQTPLPADVDFEKFEDDHGVFAAGLIHENTQRGRTVRVFVQVHNRGLKPAAKVAVKVFFANASMGLPNLPAGFWTGFPANVLPPGSPWQPVAAHQVIPNIEVGRAQIVEFDWPVPPAAANHTCLLAIVSADNDSISSGVLNVATLVRDNKKCGLKNLTVVNPPPTIGPPIRTALLNLWGSELSATYSLALDRTPTGMIRGLVLSKKLAQLAREAELDQVQLDDEEKAELARLTEENPALREQLAMEVAFRRPGAGVWLKGFELSSDRPEPAVVVIQPQPKFGHWSLLQQGEDGSPVGGYTFAAIHLEALT